MLHHYMSQGNIYTSQTVENKIKYKTKKWRRSLAFISPIGNQDFMAITFCFLKVYSKPFQAPLEQSKHWFGFANHCNLYPDKHTQWSIAYTFNKLWTTFTYKKRSFTIKTNHLLRILLHLHTIIGLCKIYNQIIARSNTAKKPDSFLAFFFCGC